MAPQGGLGRPKDSSAAPHEELCEAALSCCSKLIFLDSNKMPPPPPVFICYCFLRGEMLHSGSGERSKQTWGEEKERDNMGLGCNLNSSIIDNEKGINDLQVLSVLTGGNREGTSGGRREDKKEEERAARRRCRASRRWHPRLRPDALPGPQAFRWDRRK